MASRGKDEIGENTCVVCFKEVEIFSVGQCDHPVCFECSTRMRVLCRQNECPICRQEISTVIFTKTIRPFETIKNAKFLLDQKYKISFTSADEKNSYDELLAHVCPECGKTSPNFGHLRDHVRRVHMLNYCDLCVDNLKILTKERRCYTRKDLAIHRRVGDPDDRSHRGHPICEFCDKRYMDNDELFRHLRRDHYFCHFCDADGLHYYYKTYDSLREHFKSDHYLCEEGDCYVEKFTSVFRTDIDLKAHKTSEHGKGLSKAGLKQARTLDIAFTLAPRPRPQRNNRTGGARRDEYDREVGAVGGAPEEPPPPPLDDQQHFPADNLNPTELVEPAVSSVKTGPASKNTASLFARQQNKFSMEDFPALGPDGGAPAGPATFFSMRVNTERTSPSSDAPPQTNLSVKLSSPRFTTTVTSKKTYNSHFPALSEEAAPGPLAGSSTSVKWTFKNSQSKEAAQTAKPPAPTPPLARRPPPKMEDFPALESKSHNGPLFPATAPKKTSTALNTSKNVEPVFSLTKTKKKKTKSKGGGEIAAAVPMNASYFLKKKPEDGGKPTPADLRKAAQEKRAEAQEKVAFLYDGMVETEKSTVRQADANIKLMTSEQAISLQSSGSSSNKENKRQSANKPMEMDERAFPALSGLGPPPGFDAKWAVKKGTKPAKGPPPGLEPRKKAPPPGLEPAILRPESIAPPGFSGVDETFPPLSFGATYHSPPHFDRRNTTLINKISKALGADALEDFKQLSAAFRAGMLAPAEYYNCCKEIMGQGSFVGIFPELLALLPEISKQQELWPHYESDQEQFEAATTRVNRLVACLQCGQIIRFGELSDHLARHSLDNHFPVLKQEQATKNAWAK